MLMLLVWLRYIGLAAQVAKIAWKAWIEIKPLIRKSGFAKADIPDDMVDVQMASQAMKEEVEVVKQKIKLSRKMEKLEKRQAKLRLHAIRRTMNLGGSSPEKAPSENTD